MNVKIAIVEDEEDLLELLEYSLSKEDFEVIGFLNTKNLQELFEEEDIDLLLMDRNLPGVEGSQFVSELRSNGFTTPVIYLTAKDQDQEIEDGFSSGADDYITKPFNMKELIFRIKAILRRTSKNSNDGLLSYKDLILDKSSRTLTVNKKNIDITKLEFDLLYEFITNKHNVLDRDYLLENVWRDTDSYQYRTVNVAINRLKEKIDPDKTKNYINAVRGIGYKMG